MISNLLRSFGKQTNKHVLMPVHACMRVRVCACVLEYGERVCVSGGGGERDIYHVLVTTYFTPKRFESTMNF